jgi:hypothetical protein
MSKGNPQSPAAWTTARNEMLGNTALHRRGKQLGIDAVIITGAGYFGSAGANMVATTFEALFGAIYEDGGEAAVIAAVQHVELDNHSSLMVKSKVISCTYIFWNKTNSILVDCETVAGGVRFDVGEESGRISGRLLEANDTGERN